MEFMRVLYFIEEEAKADGERRGRQRGERG